jgi:predicted ester cyclase
MLHPLSNLRVRFLLLVIVAVLPALGLLIYSASEQRDAAVQDAQDGARRLANLAAADQGRLIESTRQLLIVLARVPEVSGDPQTCATFLGGLRAQFPLYANLGVIAPDGVLVCSAVTPPGPVNLADRSYFRNAIQTEDFAVGEYQTGRVTTEKTLNCGFPILDETGQLRGVVFAALDLTWISEFSAQAQPADGSVLTVLDRHGTVLVRSADAGDWIGKSLVGTPVVERMLVEGRGVAEGSDENGNEVLFAFAPLGTATPADAYLSVAIPRSNAEESADQVFNRSLTRLGLVLAVVLVAAWVGGDLLVRRDTEANKALVRRVYDAFDTGGVDPLDEIVAPDFVDHDPTPGQSPGLAGLKQAVGLFRAAFPDGEMTVNELVAEGDKVLARVTLCGTQSGEFGGIAATGRYVSAEGIEAFRIKRGKIVEGWSWFGPLTADGAGAKTPPGFQALDGE